MSDEDVVVGITADDHGLVEGFHHAADSAREGSEQISEAIEKAHETWKEFAELVGIGLTVEGLKEAVEQVVELDTSIQHLTDTFGISVETFSDLHAAAILADSSLGDITGNMQRLQRAAVEAEAGQAKYVEAFHALGISVAELKSLSPDQMLERVAKELTETAPSAERTANMMQLFGRNIAAVYPVLQQVAQGAHDTAEAFNAVITPDETAKSEQFSQSLGHVKLAATGIAEEFVKQVLPAVTDIVNQFAALLANSENLKSGMHDLGIAVQFVADHFDGVVESIRLLGELAIDVKIANMTQAMYATALQADAVAQGFASVKIGALGAVAAGAAAFEGWQLGTWARENFAWVAEIGQWIAAGVNSAKEIVVGAFENIWTAVKASFQALVATIESGLAAPFEYIANKLSDMGTIGAKAAQGFQSIADSIKPAKSGFDILGEATKEMELNIARAATSVKDMWSSIGKDSAESGAAVTRMNEFKAVLEKIREDAAQGHLSEEQATADKLKLADAFTVLLEHGQLTDVVYKQLAQSTALLNAATEEAHNKQSDFGGDLAKQQADAQKLQEELTKWGELMDSLSAKTSGPYDAAQAQFTATINKLDAQIVAMIGHGLSLAKAEELDAQATDLATAAMWKSIAADVEKNDKADDYLQKLKDELDKVQALTDAQKAAAEFDAIAAKNLLTLHDAYGQVHETEQDVIDANAKLKQSFVDDAVAIQAHIDAVKQNQAILKEWQAIATNAFDSAFKAIDKDIIEGGNVMKDLVNVAKTVVEEILLQFEKLAIINPLLNQIFGLSGSAALPTSSFGQIFNNVGSLFGGQGGGLFNTAGNYVNSWFGGGAGAGNITDMGAQLGPGGSLGDFTGPGTEGLNYAGGYNVTAGATEGVDQSFNAAANFGDTGAGGFSLGNLGGGLGGAMAGWQLGSQLGGPLGGALGAGGLGYLGYTFPVVGWILGAASLINSVTGGGLFGTDANKAVGGNLSEQFGPNGVDIWGEETFKGKKPLFGGSYYEEHNIPISQQQQDAANQFYQALLNGRDQFAAQFNVQMGDLIGGTFHETLDKAGKVTGTDDTIGGVKRTGETEKQFEERLESANFLAVLDKMGLGASKFVDGLQGDADKLWAAVQDFANVTSETQTNLDHGFKFMALAYTQNLSDVMTFVEGMQKAGETLTQTYQRLAQAQDAYNQFVAQFAPAPTYVDPFEASMAQLYAQMNANIASANQLAQAAGASGASLTDLAHIQEYYASQMAQLTQALQVQAQQLAFTLGLTLQGSLDQVTSEINQLEQQAKTATTATGGLSVAFMQVAQQANQAMNLLLGNLSPLNDQQKLQMALQGLREGTVTADQVLQIGQRLYASSEAYDQLFNEVMPYANGKGQQSGYYYTGGNTSPAPASGGLSPDDQKKLDELLKEQALLQNAQVTAQYQTLASQVAELAMAKGESWQQVAAEMGINIADFAKGLGLPDAAALNAYIDNLEKQTDSNTNNTTSIVAAINALPKEIAIAIQGGIPTGNTGTLPPGTTVDSSGNVVIGSGSLTRPIAVTGPGSAQPAAQQVSQSSRQFTDADASAFAKAFVKELGVKNGLGTDIGEALKQAAGPIFDLANANNPRSGRVYVR